MDYKDCRRTLKEIIEGIHNKPVNLKIKGKKEEIESKDNKNKKKIKHRGTNRREVKKNRIIKKIKKTKDLSLIHIYIRKPNLMGCLNAL